MINLYSVCQKLSKYPLHFKSYCHFGLLSTDMWVHRLIAGFSSIVDLSVGHDSAGRAIFLAVIPLFR